MGISAVQFASQSQSINMGLSGMSLTTIVNPGIGTMGSAVDMSQATPAMRQTNQSFAAAQSAPNIGGMNKNLGQLVQHPMGGVMDFTQAQSVPRGTTGVRGSNYRGKVGR